MTAKKTFEAAVSAVLQGADPAHVADQLLAETPAPAPEKKPTIGSVVETLLMDASLSYSQIVETIHKEFDNCSTSARSVASIAARLRRDNVDVPMRRKQKVAE